MNLKKGDKVAIVALSNGLLGNPKCAHELVIGDKFDTSKVTNMQNMFNYTGWNSTCLNITVTIRNPKLSEYYFMFSGVATKSGSKVTVNYTSETSWLVDQMIKTKFINLNVVKGVQVD